MRVSTLILAAGLSSLFAACSSSPTAPLDLPMFDTTLVDGPAEEIAAAFAIAFRDRALRQRLLEDLRDSPFPRHRIEMHSYLAGEDGGQIRRAAEATFVDGAQGLADALAALPSMRLEVPSCPQQATWEGEEELQVIGAEPLIFTEFLKAFTADGSTVLVGFDEFLVTITLVVFPAETDFGPDPEATRAAAPQQDRATIAPFPLGSEPEGC